MTTQTTPEIVLTDQQKLAVEMVQYNKVSILTGGPGTGKTCTIKEVLKWADSTKLKTIQCAPTGKAAKRMEEATGFSSATIHRTLAAQVVDNEFVFGYNEINKRKLTRRQYTRGVISVTSKV